MKLTRTFWAAVIAVLAAGCRGVDADDADGWHAAESLSPAVSAALGLIMALHYEYWCTEFLPYMPTPAQYMETTVTATVTAATTTTTTTTTTTKAGAVAERGVVELPGVLAPFGKKVVAEACSAVFRPGPRATTTTVVVGGAAAATVTAVETVTAG